MQNQYSLAQEFAVAASDSPPYSHTRLGVASWELFVVGAAIIEMIADGSLELGPKGILSVSDLPLAGNMEYSVVAATLRAAPKPKSLKTWIKYFYSRNKVRRRIVQQLTGPLFENGTLGTAKRRMLWIFPVTRYVADSASKDRIIQTLRAELLESGRVSDQTAFLGMLMETAKLLKPFFSEYERQELKQKLNSLHEEHGEQWNRIAQIRKAIQEMESAVATGAVAAAIPG